MNCIPPGELALFPRVARLEKPKDGGKADSKARQHLQTGCGGPDSRLVLACPVSFRRCDEELKTEPIIRSWLDMVRDLVPINDRLATEGDR